jgi:hypothetical protein
MEDDCHNGSAFTTIKNGSGRNHHDDDIPDDDNLISQLCTATRSCWQNNPPHLYCGGGSNGLYNILDCGATFTQDVVLIIDIPFAGVEMVFITIGCLEGPAGCAAGAALGIELFNGMGANFLEARLSNLSARLSIFADVADHGLIHVGEPSATAIASALAGNISPDPILDLIIDGYGSAYNHDYVNGIYSFIPFDSNPFFR